MKRFLVLFFVAFLFWSAVPAYGNTIPHLAITCDQVSFSWTGFPPHSVTLNVTVTQGDEQTLASFDTHGASSGEGSVPVLLRSGSASAVLSWTLQKTHTVGPVTAELRCTPTTTSTSTTTAPTSTSNPPTSTSNPPVAPPTPSVSPTTASAPQLANTGSSSSPWLLGFGAYCLGLGAWFIALHRRKVAP